jgi:hypothetical protein
MRRNDSEARNAPENAGGGGVSRLTNNAQVMLFGNDMVVNRDS